jgi:hypothetical protein
MRVTSDFYVSALVRRIFASGGFAAVERRGAAEAGAIFIRQRFRDGLETLFGPAPQSLFDQDDTGRRFEIRADRTQSSACEAVIEREARFDPDLWIVEIEIDDATGLIPVAET